MVFTEYDNSMEIVNRINYKLPVDTMYLGSKGKIRIKNDTVYFLGYAKNENIDYLPFVYKFNTMGDSLYFRFNPIKGVSPFGKSDRL